MASPVIDVHTHCLTEAWFDLLQEHGGPRYTVKAVVGGLRAILGRECAAGADGNAHRAEKIFGRHRVANRRRWAARLAPLDHEPGARAAKQRG